MQTFATIQVIFVVIQVVLSTTRVWISSCKRDLPIATN